MHSRGRLTSRCNACARTGDYALTVGIVSVVLSLLYLAVALASPQVLYLATFPFGERMPLSVENGFGLFFVVWCARSPPRPGSLRL